MGKNSNPIFSVIISNFNYDKYIAGAIKSVLEQTFTKFELIVVDDGSTDGSRDIIGSFNDERIKTIFKSNGGQASAFNAGFECATGKYVAFLDSDDLFDSDKLERVYAKFQEKDYALVQHYLRAVDKDGNPKDTCIEDGIIEGGLFPGGIIVGERNILNKYILAPWTGYFSATSGLTVPRRILRNIFPLDASKWKICADGPISRPLPIFGLVYTLETPAGTYRIHGNNGWMKSEIREKNLGKTQYELIEYTNKFLYRWNKNFRMENRIEPELFEKYGIKNVYVYGAHHYSVLLLLSKSIPKHIDILGVIDGSTSKDTLLNFPIIRHSSLKNLDEQTAVIIMNPFDYSLFIEKSINFGFSHIFSYYGIKYFRQQTKIYIKTLSEILKKNKHLKIALWGINFQTINLIASEVFSKKSGLQITAIYGENPKASNLFGIPVFNNKDDSLNNFDAVVILDEPNESRLFLNAIQKFKKNVYIFYGAIKALRGNRSDHEDIRRSFTNKKANKIGILGVSYFAQCLLQSNNLIDCIDVVCIIDEESMVQELFGVAVYHPENKNIPDYDVLLIPPGFKTKYEKLSSHFEEKEIFTLPENIDDIALIFDFLKTNKKNPIMFDIGANIGTSFKPFFQDEWEIYAFEPAKKMMHRLENVYGDKSNVHLIKKAISNKPVHRLPLYVSDVSDGITALSTFHYSHCFSEYVEVTTLELFLEGKELQEIDFMKIDTEGYDYFVLKGNNWDKFKPRIIMCEYEERKSLPLGYSTTDLLQFLHDLGYRMIISELDPVNEYGNQQRWRGFVEFPCPLFDEESCGNIFAFKYENDFQTFKINLPKSGRFIS
jgi:FkbM family methyltransferase